MSAEIKSFIVDAVTEAKAGMSITQTCDILMIDSRPRALG